MCSPPGLDNVSAEAFLLVCASDGNSKAATSGCQALGDPFLPSDLMRSGWGHAHFKGEDSHPGCLILSVILAALPRDSSPEGQRVPWAMQKPHR